MPRSDGPEPPTVRGPDPSIEALCAAVTERLAQAPVERRAEILTALCGGSALRAETLAAHLQGGGDDPGFLATGGAFAGAVGKRLAGWLELEDGEATGAYSGTRLGELRIEGLLGFGGMGEVYRAWDERLDRAVAVKTVRSDSRRSADARRRFRREARLLSRLNHPGICQVYRLEEGEDADFLVLELIEGETLEWQDEGGWDERRVMAVCGEIAQALAAAHRHSVVHRDLKPANLVMTPDGRVKILDFGIARLEEAGDGSEPATPAVEAPPAAVATLTQHGSVIGTVAYMSPEQARGEEVTAASDVYALGILMQELLGQPAYPEVSSLADLLPLVAEAKTLPVQGVDADLAQLIAELEAADPVSRPSASDTAERLQWILAKPERRRRRWILSSLAAALLASLGWAGWTRLEAGERERSARRYGQQAERIEALARVAQLLPLHDLGRERQVIAARMASIDEETRGGSVAIRAIGAYALGRGSLALLDAVAARRHLERAWELGLREQEVSLALGEAFGQLYREARLAADLEADPSLRERRIEEARRTLRDPALAHLREGGITPVTRQRAVLAFFEERLDEAVALARTAHDEEPWRHESRTLEGEIQLARSLAPAIAGDLEAAGAALDLAEKAFREASKIGRSDPRALLGLCRVAFARLELIRTTSRENTRPTELVAAGREACQAARQADPSSAEPWVWEARLLQGLGRWQLRVGLDGRSDLEEAVQLAEEAQGRDAGASEATLVAAKALTDLGHFAILRGEEPLPALTRAVELLDGLRQRNPRDPASLLPLGRTLSLITWVLRNRGEDPTASNTRSLEVLESAVELHPDRSQAAYNLGMALLEGAEIEADAGRDDRPLLERAATAFAQAAELDPSEPSSFQGRGRALGTLAFRLADRGEDPAEVIAEARQALARSLELDPDNVPAMDEKASVALAEGHWASRQGLDPRPAIRTGLEALDAAQAIDHDHVETMQLRVWLLKEQAGWEAANGVDPRPTVRTALAYNARVLEWVPLLYSAYLERAQLYTGLAEWRQGQGDDAAEEIAAGLQVIEEALTVRPDYPVSLAQRGRLNYLRVRAMPPSAERRKLLAEVVRDLEATEGYLLVGADDDPLAEARAALAAAEEQAVGDADRGAS